MSLLVMLLAVTERDKITWKSIDYIWNYFVSNQYCHRAHALHSVATYCKVRWELCEPSLHLTVSKSGAHHFRALQSSEHVCSTNTVVRTS